MLSKFNLLPVGISNRAVNHSEIQISEKFIPAMKNLELFTHCLVFWWNTAHSKINFCTVEMKRMNSKTGIILTGQNEIPNQSPILDLKAYIPIADRVERATVPPNYSHLPNWFDEMDFNENGPVVENTISTDLKNSQFEIAPIGIIEKQNNEKILKIEAPFQNKLNSLLGFSHVHTIWWFHRLEKDRFRRILQVNPPYEKAPKTGVFATRSPVRPNPVGITISPIKRIDVEAGILEIGGMDAYEGTPVLDFKPYIPAYDRVKQVTVAYWLAHWPEWFVEEETTATGDPDSLLPADSDRLWEYQIEAEIETTEPQVLKNEEIKPMAGAPNEQDIFIRGARQHNLKNIDITIPYRKMTVITGVSGSGKSSLAFDTLYAEGQRRYMESLSTMARQALGQMDKPEVDHIYNLTPTVAIEQKSLSRNPRSTVGTLTDISDFLRVLFAKTGIRHCPQCSRAIKPQSARQIAAQLSNLLPGTSFRLICPDSDEEKEIFEFQISEKDGASHKQFQEKLFVAVQSVLKISQGYLKVVFENEEEFLFSTHRACPHCRMIFFELNSMMFSFNSPDGMCPTCNGLGVQMRVAPNLIITQPHLSLMDGASPWFGNLRKIKPSGNWMRSELFALSDLRQVSLETPWNELPEKFRHEVLYGTGDEILDWSYDMKKRGRSISFQRPAMGAVNTISRLLNQTSSGSVRKQLLDFVSEQPCEVCHGERLCAEARFVTVGGTRFPEVNSMTIKQVHEWLNSLPSLLSLEQKYIAGEIITELKNRIQSLLNVGLHYLSLDRPAPTLSGGEGQRLRLATQLGSGLAGILYVLDEPSIGLHPRDHRQLIQTMMNLRDSGNTVVVVEHDADTMLAADYLIDMGPGAGALGGELIAAGTPQEVMNQADSLTGKYLSGKLAVTSPNGKQHRQPKSWISLTGARLHNLKNIDVKFPLGVFSCVTGVSGSGKSSLVSLTLCPAILRQLKQSGETVPGPFDKIEGIQHIDKLIQITQTPIGRTPRSNPGTYTGVFDKIRKVFAQTPEAKSRKYKESRFSFNSKDGRCEACEGNGRIKVEMHFLPDVWVPCSECRGKRFNPQTLEIKYRNKTIADVLEMDVNEALQFFSDQTEIVTILQTLYDVGMDYIKLGQSALTLSGGEAQRIKLAKELSQKQTGRTLYILDEPTTGLHFADIQKLLDVLHRLTEAGNSIIVIEHNPDVIRTADWIIDLGPEGGDEGGFVVAEGTPEFVILCEKSQTGKFLVKDNI